EAIVKNNQRVLPAAVLLEGQMGVDGLFIGAPAKLGQNGVEEIIALELDEDELALMAESAEHVRVNVERLKAIENA
ncbi:MAG: malate dehydrogenase, partial [Bacteroidota bacterium]